MFPTQQTRYYYCIISYSNTNLPQIAILLLVAIVLLVRHDIQPPRQTGLSLLVVLNYPFLCMNTDPLIFTYLRLSLLMLLLLVSDWQLTCNWRRWLVNNHISGRSLLFKIPMLMLILWIKRRPAVLLTESE